MGRKLIYQDDAIHAIDEIDWYHQNRNKDMVSGANSDDHQAWFKSDDVYKALEQIPSAQPLTETDLLELEHRFGEFVRFVVEDMLSGEEKRWEKKI